MENSPMNKQEKQLFYEFFEEIELIKKHQKDGIKLNKDVPLVKFYGISVEECLKLNEFVQELVYLIKTQNKNQTVTIIYSFEHDDLTRRNEFYKTIVIGERYEESVERDTTSLHLLHTTCSAIISRRNYNQCGNNFSLYDIMFFLKYDKLKLMIFVNDDESLYYIEKIEGYNRKENMLLLGKCAQNANNKALNGENIDISMLSQCEMMEIAKRYIAVASANGIYYDCIYKYINKD